MPLDDEVEQVTLDVLLQTMVVNVLSRMKNDKISLAELREMMLLIYSLPNHEPDAVLRGLDIALKRMESEGKIVVSGSRDVPLFTDIRLP